jgi:hypothetical protein
MKRRAGDRRHRWSQSSDVEVYVPGLVLGTQNGETDGMKEAIQEIIAALQKPLSDSERHAGWSKQIKAGYIPVFSNLLAQIEHGEKQPYFGIARSLDAYGIGGGELYEMMLRVANEANDQLR